MPQKRLIALVTALQKKFQNVLYQLTSPRNFSDATTLTLFSPLVCRACPGSAVPTHALRLSFWPVGAGAGRPMRGKFRMSKTRDPRRSKDRVVSMKFRTVEEDSPLRHAT